MKRATRILLTVAVAVTVGLFSLTLAEAKKPPKPPGGGGGPAYSLIKLAPPGVTITGGFPMDMDQAGNVVGFYDAAGQTFGFHYDLNQDAWLLFGSDVKVLGLNNFGEMVGLDQNTGEGLYWSSPNDQNPVTLSPLPGDQGTAALRINDNGIIIGESGGSQGVTAVAWAVDDAGVVSAPLVLPKPAGDTSASVQNLNQSDQDGVTQIVGATGASYPGDTAIRWEVTTVAGIPILVSGPLDLGSLDGAASGARGINVFGDIVGVSGVWPFFKPAGGPMQPLPGIRKATSGSAGGINDTGAIVGSQAYLKRGVPIFKAVLWTSTDSVDDLNQKVNLGASEVLEGAFRINNAGQILGSGFFPGITGADNVGFLLVPNG